MRVPASLLLAAAILMMPAARAEARTRDEVMAEAFRCGTVADDWHWLECYYGAAQALRAQLGLVPAPRFSLTQSPPAGTAHDILARDQALAGAAGCYTFADDRQWLGCFFGAAQLIGAKLGLPPTLQRLSADSPVNRPPPIRSSRNSDFFSGMLGSQTHRVVSRMTSYDFDTRGIFTVALENGQIWHQQAGDTAYARWKKPAAAYLVTITDGALGSLNMEVRGEPHIFKVERQK